MKALIIVLIFLLFLQQALGATITGSIYDLELKKVDNAVVSINTIPVQKVVGESYSFQVSTGEYTIKATYFDEGTFKYSTEENITIIDNGSYNLDLFLFADLEDEEELFVDEATNIDDVLNSNSTSIYAYLGLGVVVVIFIILMRMRRPEDDDKLIDEDLEKVIKIIKKEGGRIYQKDLRKQLGLSEAKVSLMITELENKGKVERIKKGRGNVIVINNKRKEEKIVVDDSLEE